jgi:hypothetical protein
LAGIRVDSNPEEAVLLFDLAAKHSLMAPGGLIAPLPARKGTRALVQSGAFFPVNSRTRPSPEMARFASAHSAQAGRLTKLSSDAGPGTKRS